MGFINEQSFHAEDD